MWKWNGVTLKIEVQKIPHEFMFLFNQSFILDRGYSILLLQAVLWGGGSRCDGGTQTAHSLAAPHNTARSVPPEG